MTASGGTVGRLGEVGRVIDDRFRLDTMLGAGGFGEVWRATRLVEGDELREVALKLLVAPEQGGSEGRGDDWLNEVRAVQKVDCPAVAPIYDVGVARAERLAFISMQLLTGETVGDRLDRGPIPWRRALAIAREVAAALEACHAVDVMHCDLKPGNIFLRDDGQVFVLDFGVARLGADGPAVRPAPLATAEEWQPGETGTVEVTGSQLPPSVPQVLAHQVYGTPGYIAPERYSGEPPSAAGDAYALGVVLYRMIAGRLPYQLGADAAVPTSNSSSEAREAYRAQLHTATVLGQLTPLAEVVPDVPSGVAELVAELLATEPGDRPTSLVARVDRAWRRPYGIPEPPYVGLEALDPHRAGAIAGRDADIEQIAGKLAGQRTIVLVGPSGCGKSSLAMAGVAARIDEQMVDGTDGWRTVVVRPSDGALTVGGSGGADSLGVTVVVDQLEEVLGLADDELARFGEALVALAAGDRAVTAHDVVCAPGAPVRVIATVRDDLFGRVAALPELERIPEQNVYTVRGVEPNAMDEIVEGPARDAGYQLEGADQVVASAQRLLARDSSALPLVQFALTTWWEQRDAGSKTLTREAWDGLGGIEGALAQAAQTLHDGMEPGDRERMKQVLVALFRPDGTRVIVDEKELATDADHRRVIDALVASHLVKRQADSERPALEVVHEALAERWPPLKSWLEETRAERELISDADYEAERWVRAGRPREQLWRGARLAAAEEITDKLRGDARACVTAATHERRRRARFVRAVGIGVSILGVVAIIALVAALVLRGDLDQAEGEVEAKRAELEKLVGDVDAIRTEKRRLETERKARERQMQRLERAFEDASAEVDAARAEAAKIRGEAETLRADAEAKARAAEAKAAAAARKLEEAREQNDKISKQRAAIMDQMNRCREINRDVCEMLLKE